MIKVNGAQLLETRIPLLFSLPVSLLTANVRKVPSSVRRVPIARVIDAHE